MTRDGETGSDAAMTHGRAPRCPRCGYDQRGVLAVWNGSCPLDGRCTECGLEFRWAEVLVPEKFEPAWCVEFEPSRNRWPMACVKTLVRSLWPWGFWRRIRMSYPVRGWRLAAYGIALLAPLLVTYVAAQTWVAVRVHRQMQREVATLPAQHRRSARTLERLANQSSGDLDKYYRRKAEEARQAAQMPYALHQSRLMAVAEAILLPFGKQSFGSRTIQGVRMDYAAPGAIWSTLRMPRRSVRIEPMTGWIAFSIAMAGALPVAFLLLPVTMRQARVRRRHLIRVMVYGLWLPVVIAVFSGAATLYLYIHATSGLAAAPTLTAWIRSANDVVVRLGIPLGLVVWWCVAARRYLKIPHAILATLALALVSLLAVTTLVFLVWPQDLVSLLVRWEATRW